MCVNLRQNRAISAHNIYLIVKTDAEVFVKRNIDISSVHAAILYLFQFQNKNGRFPVCLPVTAHAWDHKVER